MTVQAEIEKKLADGINAMHMEVINESSNHNVPPGSESHFKVVLVSDDFADKKLLQRHQLVNQILAEELQGKIHALAIHTYTESEWQEISGGAPMSPPCQGGDGTFKNA
ncbi:MAG: BolA/IbaG family iron-sulfur metabolism protein [Thioalkalispiraceae bacterium]|jgi:BolA protein